MVGWLFRVLFLTGGSCLFGFVGWDCEWVVFLWGGWLCINRALVCYESVLIRSGSSPFAGGEWGWFGYSSSSLWWWVGSLWVLGCWGV